MAGISDILGKYKVLVVEDEPTVLNSISNMFKELFPIVDTAINGEDGLELYKKALSDNNKYDIVFTDINMPKMDGIVLSKRIRELNIEQQIVIISAHNESHLLKEIINIQVNYYIFKPIIFDNFIEVLSRVHNALISQKEKEKKFNIVKNYDSKVITLDCDLNGFITYISAAFLNLIGCEKEDLLNKHIKILRNRSIPLNYYRHIWNVLKSDETYVGEIKHIKKGGHEHWLKITASPNFNDLNYKIGYSFIYEDIQDKKDLELISNTDSLTKLYNRRFFNDVLKVHINQAKRKNEIIYFLMLDIDYFKLYNDFYGHFNGDKTLIEVSNLLIKSLKRINDYAFRLGGEEFAVLFDSKTPENAIEFANKIRKNIEDLKIEHIKSDVSSCVTVSIGLSCIKSSNIKDFEELYIQTDKLLYEAKITGRNRVVYGVY